MPPFSRNDGGAFAGRQRQRDECESSISYSSSSSSSSGAATAPRDAAASYVSSSSSRSPSPKAGSRRRVRFASVDGVRVRPTIRRCDVTPREAVAAFWSQAEIRTIRKSAKADAMILELRSSSSCGEAEAEALDAASESSNDGYCPRGVEAKTKAGRNRKTRAKVDSRAAVFFEQELRMPGACDEETALQVAEAYAARCGTCAAEAIERGASDEVAAMAIHAEEEEEEVARPTKEAGEHSQTPAPRALSMLVGTVPAAPAVACSAA